MPEDQRQKQGALNRIDKYIKLIPVLYARGSAGMSLEELKTWGDFENERQIQEMVQALLMWGSFPLSPGDYISIWQEGDRIYLDMPQGLDRPFAPTEQETMLLVRIIEQTLSARLSGSEKKEHLLSILSRITGSQVMQSGAGPGNKKRELIEEALSEKLQMQFLYRGLSSMAPELRRIDPWLLFYAEGQSYVSGFCYLRQEARYFHLDRMEDPVILNQPQEHEPPPDLGTILSKSPIFSKEPTGFAVRLRFRPEIQGLVERYLQIEGPVEAANGFREATMVTQNGYWLRSLLRSLGPGIEIVSPEHMRQSMVQELEQLVIPEPLG